MMMTSLSTAVFRKLRTCPSAETLLLYTAEGLQREGLSSVTAHLAACDFCGAELKLLSEHPPCGCSLATTQAGEMPSDLRRLAEDIRPTLAEQGALSRRSTSLTVDAD